LLKKDNCKMNKLIIDAAKTNIFFMIINKDTNYSISHENTKANFEKMMILINDFLDSKNLDNLMNLQILLQVELNFDHLMIYLLHLYFHLIILLYAQYHKISLNYVSLEVKVKNKQKLR